MSIPVACSCGAKLRADDDAAGKTVACPKCKTRLKVPSPTDEESDASSETPPSKWLTLGATLVISLVVGAAGGFIFGHRQGRSENAQEVAEAQAFVATAAQKLRAAEADSAKAMSEREKVKEQLNAVVRDHDARLAALKQSEEKAKTRARIAEGQERRFWPGGDNGGKERLWARKDFQRMIAGKTPEELRKLIGDPDEIEENPRGSTGVGWLYGRVTYNPPAKNRDAWVMVYIDLPRISGNAMYPDGVIRGP